MDPAENLRQRLSLAREILANREADPDGVTLADLALLHCEPTVEMRRLARRLVESDDDSRELAELVLAYARWRTMNGFEAAGTRLSAEPHSPDLRSRAVS